MDSQTDFNKLKASMKRLTSQPPDISKIVGTNSAEAKMKILLNQIKQFESNLDQEHEVAVQFASFGTDVLMAVTKIGFHNSDILCFYGYVNGIYAQLIQHSSQLNFLITAVEKEDNAKPARRIGFI